MTRWAVLWVAGGLAIAGCNDGGSDSGGGAADMAAAAGADGGPQVTVTGTVVIGGGNNASPLANATVKLADSSTSVTTGSDGKYRLVASAGTVFLVASADGY